MDLKQHAGMYSLQIGFYDEAFGKEFRKAAEEMATILREDGVEAYYYHGPNISMVTVGLFDDSDLVKREVRMPNGLVSIQEGYGPRIKVLQEQFPNNLGNGATVIDKIDGQNLGPQPSFLVRVR